jgi:hypothetical protein
VGSLSKGAHPGFRVAGEKIGTVCNPLFSGTSCIAHADRYLPLAYSRFTFYDYRGLNFRVLLPIADKKAPVIHRGFFVIDKFKNLISQNYQSLSSYYQ